MKKWQQWSLYILFMLIGAVFMGYAIANWGKVSPLKEWTAIGFCVAFESVFVWIGYKYKLEIDPPEFFKGPNS